MRRTSPRSLTLFAALLLLALPGCQGEGLTGGGNSISGNPDGGSFSGSAAPRDGVAVSARDLEPVDTYFRAGRGGANTRWILGNTVDIVASKEYFASILSINRGPFVARTDRREGSDLIVTLNFLGNDMQASAANNPRVQIGTGLTVSALKTIRVRLMKTRDARVPVRLHITARGQASRGHREEVLQRGSVLTMGGQLMQQAGQWIWSPH